MLGHKILTIRARVVRVTAVALVGTMVFGGGLASAKVMHRYTSRIWSAPVSTTNAYPSPGGSAVVSGALTINPFGAGGVVDHVKITGRSGATRFDFAGTEVDYFANGTWRSRFTGAATLESDGNQQVSVYGHITGGTERYAGAAGYYVYHGAVPSGSSILAGHSTGWVTY